MKTSHNIINMQVLLGVIMLFVFPAQVLAQVPPPNNGNRPVEVGIKFLVNDILDVSTVEETFDIDGYLTLIWTDSALLKLYPGIESENLILYNDEVIDSLFGKELWHPNVEIINAVGSRVVTKRRVEIFGAQLVYVERFQAKMQSIMDFRPFPFDEQTFNLVFESFGFNATQFVFVPMNSHRQQMDGIQNDSWEFNAVLCDTSFFSYKSSISKASNEQVIFSRFEFSIQAKRNPGYFIWQFFLPLFILIVATWFIPTLWKYGIARELIFTMLLTTIMFSFYTGEFLPQLSYNTFLEIVVIVTNGIMLATMLQVLTRKKETPTTWFQRTWIIPVVSILAFLITIQISFQLL